MTHFPTRATGAAFALLAATLLGGCGGDETTETDAPAPTDLAGAPEDVQFRSVALSGPAADGTDAFLKDSNDVTDLLADLGLEESDDAITAIEWFTAGDCAAAPMSTPEIAAACSSDGTEVLLMGPVALDGAQVAEAEHNEHEDMGDSVDLVLDDEGSQALAVLTQEARAKSAVAGQIAITVDGAVAAAPTVQTVITTGQVSIAGSAGDDTLRALADALG